MNLELTDARDLLKGWSHFAPTEHPRLLTWAREHIVTDLNKPYDHDRFPYIGAPGGPADAFDDHNVREIALQWASRLGKTFFGQMTTIYNGVQLRLPQIFGSTNETLALQVVQRTYKMLRNVPKLSRALVKPERMQNMHLIEFWGCQVFVGWSRSAATFADKDCHRGHKNEYDDWTHLTTSKDGDPGDQFDERFKNHQGDRKVVAESIPKVKGKSRTEAKRLAGWNCEYMVPCPHCKKFQQVELGDSETDYGIKFEVVNHSVVVAWYECRHCHERIENYHRAGMMRRGVWVPEGCGVDHEAAYEIDSTSPDYRWNGWKNASWVTGKPARDNEIASHRLATYVSRAVSWNDCAQQFYNSKGKPQKLRNFVNQWDGNTWEIRRSRSEPEAIAERCRTEYDRGFAPEWVEFLTLTIDRQKADGGSCPWVVMGHGSRGSHVVDYGIDDTLEKVWAKAWAKPYHHESASLPLYISATAIDSGWTPKVTYEFCQDESHTSCVPCKGGSAKSGDEHYKWTDFEDSKHDTEGLSLLLVNTNYSETALQHMLDEGAPGEPGGLGLCVEAAKDFDFIGQLTNMILVDKIDTAGEPVLQWSKKDDGSPNDFRDAIRYGIALGQAWIDEGGTLEHTDNRTAVEKRADGRDWND